jgi:hypothetical protein
MLGFVALQAASWLGIKDVEAELSREAPPTTQLLLSSTSKFAGLGSRKEDKHRVRWFFAGTCTEDRHKLTVEPCCCLQTKVGVQYSLERKIFKSSKAIKDGSLRENKDVEGVGGSKDKQIEDSDSEGRGGAFKKKKRKAVPELHAKSKMLLDRHYERRKGKTVKNAAEK